MPDPTYATQDEARSRYDPDMMQRIVLDRASGTADWTKLDLALEDATAEIDSYLTARYPVPLIAVPSLVKRMCVDMAIYHAALTSDRLTEEMANRYKGWIAHLKMIAAGQAGLGIRATQAPTDPSTTMPVPPEGTGTYAVQGTTTTRV